MFRLGDLSSVKGVLGLLIGDGLFTGDDTGLGGITGLDLFSWIRCSLFLGHFKLRKLTKMKEFVSATPLKPLNRISWNFVVMKDIMCRCAYPQGILIQLFFLELRPF